MRKLFALLAALLLFGVGYSRPAISGSTIAQASVLLTKLDGIADALKNAR